MGNSLGDSSGHHCPSEGAGVVLAFISSYVGLDPASTVDPKKISGISGIPKKSI